MPSAGQKPAFEDAMAQMCCPDRRIDRLCITRLFRAVVLYLLTSRKENPEDVVFMREGGDELAVR